MTTQRIPEFYQGYKDFVDGRLNNPYRPNTIKSKEWEQGQNVAFFDQAKKLGAYRHPGKARLDVNARIAELKAAGFLVAAAHFEKHGLVLVNASL